MSSKRVAAKSSPKQSSSKRRRRDEAAASFMLERKGGARTQTERAVLAKNLIRMGDDLVAKQSTMSNFKSAQQSEALSAANTANEMLHAEVRHASEAVREASNLAQIAAMTHAGGKASLNAIHPYEPGQFLDALRKRFFDNSAGHDGEIDWNGIAALGAPYSSVVFSNDFLNGEMGNVMKEKVARVSVRAKSSHAAEVSAKDVTQKELEEEDAGFNKEQMEKILRYLPLDGVPLSFFEALISPRSFCETVENVYTMAQIVKSARAEIFDEPECDADGGPGEEEYDQAGNVLRLPVFRKTDQPVLPRDRNNQCVMSFTPADISYLTRVMGISKSFIPERNRSKDYTDNPFQG